MAEKHNEITLEKRNQSKVVRNLSVPKRTAAQPEKSHNYMIIANGIFYNGTEAEKVYLGNDLVWEKTSTPKPAHQIMGKFTDDSTEANWKCKINGSTIILPVDPTTKEFGYDYEGKVTNLYQMFASLSKLKSIDLSGLDTSEVTNMGYMFQYCSGLESANLSGLTNEKVTDMTSMFYGTNVKSIDLTNFKTPNVTSMSQMFSWGSTGNPQYTTLDLSSFDTSRVTDMGLMFFNNKKLQSIDISSFNTSRVTNMYYMFSGCEALTTLDLHNFSISNADIGGMFYKCEALTTLDLSGWNVYSAKNMSQIFEYCNALTTVLGPITGLKFYIDLKSCPLTNASAMVFINGLVEVTETKSITFKASTFDTLTDEQIAVATSKGWNVVRSA